MNRAEGIGALCAPQQSRAGWKTASFCSVVILALILFTGLDLSLLIALGSCLPGFVLGYGCDRYLRPLSWIRARDVAPSLGLAVVADRLFFGVHHLAVLGPVLLTFSLFLFSVEAGIRFRRQSATWTFVAYSRLLGADSRRIFRDHLRAYWLKAVGAELIRSLTFALLGLGLLSFLEYLHPSSELVLSRSVLLAASLLLFALADRLWSGPMRLSSPWRDVVPSTLPHSAVAPSLPSTRSKERERLPVLEVEHASYGAFTMKEGEVLAIVARTERVRLFARCLVGLSRLPGLQIAYKGKALPETFSAADHRVYAREIQVVFENPRLALDPRKTVHEAISEGPLLLGRWQETESKYLARDALGRVGLSEELLGARIADLTDTQTWGVSFARALVLEPRLLILEKCSESEAALPFVLRVVRESRDSSCCGVLLLTTDPVAADPIADRVLVLDGAIS